MISKGECLACTRVGSCQQTNFEKVYWGFTCPLFEGVVEPEYQARIHMMQKYGETFTIRALLNRPEEGEKEDA